MLAWLRIAARSLLRNGRRSLFTVLAIGLGYAAVNVFGGFTEYMFTGLEDSHIYAQGNGHLTVFKKGFLDHRKLNPVAYLLSEADLETITTALKDLEAVEVVTPKLAISGLLSNGDVSTVFVASGRVPSDMQAIRGRGKGLIAKVKLFEGKPLEDDIPYGIGLSSGLARQLKLELGSNAIAMAPTVTGQINALDVEVFQLFDAAVEVVNDMLMVVPLTFAQSLYDTTGVDRVVVLLSGSGQTERMQRWVSRLLADRGTDVEVRTWKELDPAYSKVKAMFGVIFLFIFVIVFIIAVMSVVNTMSLAVMERTREIGTLRALGVRRAGIVRLFALEGAMLGAAGSGLGLLLTLATWLLVNLVIQPRWVPPMITKRVPLEVYLVPSYLLYSGAFLILLSVLAAIFPARKAAHQEVVEALGHV